MFSDDSGPAETTLRRLLPAKEAAVVVVVYSPAAVRGEGGRLSEPPGWEDRDTAESVEIRRGGTDTRALSLALSTSGTLPVLPLLVSSDKPLSTPANL
jgi:hypothetical protein